MASESLQLSDIVALSDGVKPMGPYHSADHCEALRDNVDRSRIDGCFSDVTLCVGKQEFPCHRVILAGGSPYFRSMFASGMEESHNKRIELHEVDADVFEHTLKFVYTGHVNITTDIAPELFTQAHIFQINPLIDLCVQFFKENISDMNCLGAMTLADIHAHKALYEFTKAYTCSHLTSLIEEEDFVKLSLDCVVDLFKDRRLECASEEVVYDAAMKWLESDIGSRRSSTYKLLKCVKFPLISQTYLMDTVVKNNHYVKDERLIQLLDDAVTFHTVPSRRNMLPAYQVTPRYSFPFFEAAVLLGGRLVDGLSNEVECFRADKNYFFSLKQLPFRKRNEFAVCTIADAIYVSGGLRSSEFWKYDTTFETWLRGGTLTHARRRHAMVAVDHSIYVLGGFDEDNVLNSIERWDSKQNKWEEVGALQHSVENMGYVAYGQKIYLFGGKNNDEQVTSLIQCFDTLTNRCTVMESSCPANDMCLSAAVLNGDVYVVGLEGAFRYHPASEEWETLPDMGIPRDFISLAVLNEKLYAFGGRRRGAKDSLYSDLIECFDPMTNSWKEAGAIPMAMYCYGSARVYLCDTKDKSDVAIHLISVD